MTTLPIYIPNRDFILPYIYKELGSRVNDVRNDIEIMLSSTAIYPAPCENADEAAPVDSACEWFRLEKEFTDKAVAKGRKTLIIRCGEIIGTGMNGFPGRLARMVWRGTFFHFPSNETRLSCIHASDVAALLGQLMTEGVPADFPTVVNLTDGCDCTIHDLAEALAYRMNEKRISTLSTGPQQWLGRLLYGKKLMSELMQTRTADSSLLRSLTGFNPVPVCTYLREHVYDETSL